MRRILKIWFDFGNVSHASGVEYPISGDLNKYDELFFYRSKRLESITPQHLVNIIIAYAHLIRTNEQALREQIEAAL